MITLKMLENGEIDAALIALPAKSESLQHKKLFDDEFLLAVPHSHPLSKREVITRRNLEDESLLLLDDGHCLRDQALDLCSQTGSLEQQDFRATSLETLRQMVASGIGITLIPKIAKKENDGVVYIPFESSPPLRQIAMVWRKTSARKKCIDYILDVIGSVP